MLGSQSQTIIGRPIVPDATVNAVVEEHVSKTESLSLSVFPHVLTALSKDKNFILLLSWDSLFISVDSIISFPMKVCTN